MKAKALRLSVLLFGFFMAQIGFAGPKTLIEMDGGKVTAGLAKSWKPVKAGQYDFELDTSKEIGKGVNVSPDAVKQSLEGKLGSSYGVKVTPKGAGGVSVAYTGDEKQFLEQVAKTKIRAGKDVELALESSVSEGGIRAKKADRPAGADEVKAIALKIEKGVITAKVNDTKSAKVKANDMIKVKGELAGLKKNETFFFKPDKKQGDAWMPAAGSLQ